MNENKTPDEEIDSEQRVIQFNSEAKKENTNEAIEINLKIF